MATNHLLSIQGSLLALLGVLLFLVPRDEFGDGVQAYREQRYDDALAALTAAAERAGSDASAQLLYDRALAALQSGAFREAEIAAELAAVRGGDAFAELRDFLFGNTAFARGLQAERRADLPEAEPFAYDVAIQQVEKAKGAWEQALLRRGDWPEASRNIERAVLRLEGLRRKKQKKEEEQKKKEEPDWPEEEPEPEEREEEPQEPDLDPSLEELSPEKVLRLLEKLALEEQEKRALRRSERQQRSRSVERDW